METPPITHSHPRWVVLLILTFAIGVLAAWTWYTQPGVLGKADAVGYAICHRIAERSFMIDGRPLPLCARCTGIYLGVMTGLGVFVASGRHRAGYLPNWKVNVMLGLFVVFLGLDGINSYFYLYPEYNGPYEPQNWLRLTTGVFTGLSLITLVFPIFNQSIWQGGGHAVAPIRNLKELAGVCLLLVLMILLTLSQNATILLVLALISALGVVTVLTMIFSVMVVTIMQRFRTYQSWRHLWVPVTAGLALAILMIGAINVARYTATGTWEGFVF